MKSSMGGANRVRAVDYRWSRDRLKLRATIGAKHSSNMRRMPNRLSDPNGEVSVVGHCHAPVVVLTCELQDFYRGYALVGIPAAVLAVLLGIVFFAIGILP